MQRFTSLAVVASLALLAPVVQAAEPAVQAAEPTAEPTVPSVHADATGPADPIALERARVVAKGKRLGWVGMSLSFGGFLMTLTSAAPTNTTDTTIALASAGVGVAVAGVVVAAAGLRRVRRPEKFMRNIAIAGSPWLSPSGAGASLALRF
jgi:hypothetical protein